MESIADLSPLPIADASLLRLLQLSSAALPVGGYAFSNGLEWAVESRWLSSSDDVIEWLSAQLSESIATLDLPILRRQCLALSEYDIDAVVKWNSYILACRESSELRLTDTALGSAMIRLLRGLSLSNDILDLIEADLTDKKLVTSHIINTASIKTPLSTLNAAPAQISYVTAFAVAATHWRIPAHHAAIGYTWAWLENQIAAATKLTLFGQLTAQSVLDALIPQLEKSVSQSLLIDDDAIGGSLPGLAIASSHHETQYSRLFRS